MNNRRLLEIRTSQQWHSVVVHQCHGCKAVIQILGNQHVIEWADLGGGAYSLLAGGRSYDVTVTEADGTYQVSVNGTMFLVPLRDPKEFRGRSAHSDNSTGPCSIAASMPGKVIRLLVCEGDMVEEGQGVAVVEAMKMQNELRTPKGGIVKRIEVAENQAVNAGERLLIIE